LRFTHGDLDHFVACARWLNNRLKTCNYLGADRFFWFEMGCLTGYRNPPVLGFDVLKEAQSLANGGEPHHWPLPFDDLVAQALKMDVHGRLDWLTFDAYVSECKWATSGASSRGYLTVITPDGEVRVKAKKNFVMDTTPTALLAEAAATSHTQLNSVIIKAELGKVRLAVASSLETYLKEAYLRYCLNGAYLDWPGSTIEEKPREQLNRMVTMLQDLSQRFGLGYDFDAFDHQPETSEIKSIVKHMIDHAAKTLPSTLVPQFLRVMDEYYRSFDFSVLRVNIAGLKASYRVKGGVMSGLGLTSILGNGWNSTSMLGARILSAYVTSLKPVRLDIRGDDTAAIFDTPSQAQLFELALRSMGVRGGVGKFSIQGGQIEFLRTWFDKRCFGYPCRTIPGLTQRKPWTAAPWDEVGTLTSIRDTCMILVRRGGLDFWPHFSSVWAQLHHLPSVIVNIPRHLGGLGLGRWDGMTRVDPPFPRVERVKAIPVMKTSWRVDRIRTLAAEYKVKLTEDQIHAVASDELNAVLGSDDIPSISRMYRDSLNFKLKYYKPHFSLIPLHQRFVYKSESFTNVPKLPGRSSVDDIYSYPSANSFGAFQHSFGADERVKPLLRQTKESYRSWLRRERPQLWQLIRGNSHMGERIDWLTGNTHAFKSDLHPFLASIADRIASHYVVLHKMRGFRTSSLFAAVMPAVIVQVQSLDVYNKVCRW
jgi:hypothetical protein